MNAASELETLKTRLKSVWTTGDFGQIAKYTEKTAEEFIARLEIKPDEKVLDVACGTGNTAIPAARRGAVVTGVDIAANLLEQAERRAAEKKLTIRFDEGDAENLAYADDSFDLIVSMFGVMFAPRPKTAMAEMLRVCKKGGRIALASWTAEGFSGRMFRLAAKYAAPPADIPPPVLWGDEPTVRERFGKNAADLQMTRRKFFFDFPFPPVEVVNFFRTFFGPTQKTFAALDAENQIALENDLVRMWTEHNQAAAGATLVEGEYLETIAVV